jgi:lactam utilization protein B
MSEIRETIEGIITATVENIHGEFAARDWAPTIEAATEALTERAYAVREALIQTARFETDLSVSDVEEALDRVGLTARPEPAPEVEEEAVPLPAFQEVADPTQENGNPQIAQLIEQVGTLTALVKEQGETLAKVVSAAGRHGVTIN